MRKTNISVSVWARDTLASMGRKGDSFDDIVCDLIHFRNIMSIHDIVKNDMKVPAIMSEVDLNSVCRTVFEKINFETVPPFVDNGLNGDGSLKEWESFDQALEWAMGMAGDEDLVGANRTPTPAELVTNVYCLMCSIPAPTWNIGAMRNPLAP